MFLAGLLVVCRLCDLLFLSLLKDSLKVFLKDFLLEIGVSPEPDKSVGRNKKKKTVQCKYNIATLNRSSAANKIKQVIRERSSLTVWIKRAFDADWLVPGVIKNSEAMSSTSGE